MEEGLRLRGCCSVARSTIDPVSQRVLNGADRRRKGWAAQAAEAWTSDSKSADGRPHGSLDVTERAAQRIVGDLVESGYIDRSKEGRRR
jgi:hypothetical protein